MHPNIEQLAELAGPRHADDKSPLVSHVSHCAECQSRVYKLRGLMTHLREDTAQRVKFVYGEHISDDELIGYVQQTLALDQHERVKLHIRGCGPCMKEVLLYRSHLAEARLPVQSLPLAAQRMPPLPRSWKDMLRTLFPVPVRAWMGASAALLVAIFGAWILPASYTQRAQYEVPPPPVMIQPQESEYVVPPEPELPVPEQRPEQKLTAPQGEAVASVPEPKKSPPAESAPPPKALPPVAVAPAPTPQAVPAVLPPQIIGGKESVAVVIGNRDYSRSGLPNAEFALNDAQAVKEYLINAQGFDPSHIIYMEDATAARFNEVFGSADNPHGRLHAVVTPAVSDVFIYYSGHGTPDIKSQRAYFVPVDADPKFISLSGYALDTLYKNIRRLPARSVTMVLDASFSGRSAGGSLLRDVSPALVQIQQPLPALKCLTFFASADFQQVSAWDTQRKHGLFTYYFLQGLEGAADSDRDGVIATSELNQYLQSNVPYEARRVAGIEQAPQFAQSQDRAFRGPLGPGLAP